MKSFDEQIDELLEDRPQDLHEEEGTPPLRIPDDDDLEELVQDGYDLLSELLDRPMPKALKQKLVELHARYEEIIGWTTFH